MANSVTTLHGIQRCCCRADFALNYASGHARTHFTYGVSISTYEVLLKIIGAKAHHSRLLQMLYPVHSAAAEIPVCESTNSQANFCTALLLRVL
jgi:hypothetical protein